MALPDVQETILSAETITRLMNAPAAPQVEPHTHAGLSPSQAAQVADWTREDVAKGKLSPEAAAKIFDDLGVPLDQRAMPADLRSPEQQLLDAHFPMARPEDFSISYGPPGQAPR